jgi:hypothetical protein
MKTLCINFDCEIVKIHHQCCVKQAHLSQLTNYSNDVFEKNTCTKSDDGTYYCSQFTD